VLKFVVIFLYRKVLCYYCDFLTWFHFRLTSRKATEDAFREMILEHVRYRHRMCEQKCYHLWCELFIIASELGIEIIEPEPDFEKVRHSEKDFENE